LIVSGRDSAVDFEVSNYALDAITLTIERLAVADCRRSVGFRRDHCFDAALFEVVPYCISIVGFVAKERSRQVLWQIDQRIVGLAVCRFAGREVEGDRPSLGITETMNFTGEPAPRAAKSSLMNPPFPPAAETWARTVVLSML
jgi:hypothetical protein